MTETNLVVMHGNYTENIHCVSKYYDSKGRGCSVAVAH